MVHNMIISHRLISQIYKFSQIEKYQKTVSSFPIYSKKHFRKFKWKINLLLFCKKKKKHSICLRAKNQKEKKKIIIKRQESKKKFYKKKIKYFLSARVT